jgi:glycosyl hydrolase family 16
VRLDEHFVGEALDPAVWLPAYLPHWSSLASSAATYRVGAGELRLSIPNEQPLWCADRHDGPLRVSCVQTANFSGPVGSTIGGQPFAAGLTVREEQPAFWGYTPRYGHVEVRMRAVITSRSMVACWLSGLEDRPERSGEICLVEIFGDAVRPGSAAVGIGLHKFRDPALTEEFSALPLPIDVAEFHTYAVDWRPGSLVFTVDGSVVRRIGQAPDYPVQLELGVFDFPGKADPAATTIPVPELVVSHVIGRPLD